jgi:glycogen operon protein
VDTELLAFTHRLLAFRKAHPVLRRRRFLAGVEASEIGWFTPAGQVMTGVDWADRDARCLAINLDGSDDADRADDGSLLIDDDVLLLINSWWEPLEFTLPVTRPNQSWCPDIDTFDPSVTPDPVALHAGETRTVGPRSLVVLVGGQRAR